MPEPDTDGASKNDSPPPARPVLSYQTPKTLLADDRYDEWAGAGFVYSIMGLPLWLIVGMGIPVSITAIVLCFLALRGMNRTGKGRFKNMAIAGLIIGLLPFLLAAVAFVMLMFG